MIEQCNQLVEELGESLGQVNDQSHAANRYRCYARIGLNCDSYAPQQAVKESKELGQLVRMATEK